MDVNSKDLSIKETGTNASAKPLAISESPVNIKKHVTGDGKGTEANEDNEVEATEIMEFVPAASINDAKVGNTVRFMHNTGEGTVYWLQGTVEKRLTKYKIARDCKFANNFFRIGSLKVIRYWGKNRNLYQRQ